VEFKNLGQRDLCVAEDTVLYGLGPEEIDGFGNEGDVVSNPFYIFNGIPTLNDSSSDNPPAYSNYDIRVENNGSYVWLYFGAPKPGEAQANEFDLDIGGGGGKRVIHNLSLMVFAYWVDDAVLCSDAATQGTPYAQTIPFQAVIVIVP
jgi:hypothetical protein